MNNWEKEVQESLLKNEKAVITELKKSYKTALNDVNSKLENYALRIENDLTDVSAFHQLKYQVELKKQINESLNALQSNNFKTINNYLNGCYTNSYIGSFYNMQKQGVPLIVPINKADIVRAVTLNSKISDGLYKHLGVDVDKLKKDISAEVTRGVTTGETWVNTAHRLEQRGGIPLHNAVRIARTEGHRIQISGTLDAVQNAKEKGANIVKQWDATLDSNTRETHRELDGQIAEVDDPFKYSGGEVYAPSQFGDPAEDCNCRCCLLQRAKWNIDDATFTKMNGDTGELVRFNNDSYAEFKKDFWGQCEVINNNVEKSINKTIYNELSFDEYKKMADNMIVTPEEYLKVSDFDSGYISTANSFKINRCLRNDTELSEVNKETVTLLDKIIKQNKIDKDFKTVRFCSSNFTKYLNDNGVKKGDIITEKGFMSTSANVEHNVFSQLPVQITINVPKGTSALFTKNYDESEIIFNHGIKYKVDEFIQSGNNIKMGVTLIEI